MPTSRFLDWNQVAQPTRKLVANSAATRAVQLEPRLHAYALIEVEAPNSEPKKTLSFLPYAVKDLFASGGHHPGCGFSPDFDSGLEGEASVLRSLRAAGAVRVGFTHMTELAYEPSGYNSTRGCPRNPWNTDFIPGGSSSGSAIAVASGSAVIALGSDSGGSIRIPSHCCGTTGWKSTWRKVNSTGALPLAPSLDSIGLIARSAADLFPAARILAPELREQDPIERIVVLDDTIEDADTPIANACRCAVDVLSSLNFLISRTKGLTAIKAIDGHALLVMQAEAARTHEHRLNSDAISPSLRKRLEKGLAIDNAALVASRDSRDALARHFEERVLGSADAAILPVMPIQTPLYEAVDPTSQRFSGRTLYALSGYCRFVNMLGFPSVAFPVGFDEHDMPVAMQVVGRAGRDLDLLAFVARFQEATSWHARVPAAIRDLVDDNFGQLICQRG